jgi:hypothetical protein
MTDLNRFGISPVPYSLPPQVVPFDPAGLVQSTGIEPVTNWL